MSTSTLVSSLLVAVAVANEQFGSVFDGIDDLLKSGGAKKA